MDELLFDETSFRGLSHFVQPGEVLRQPGDSLRQPGAALRQPGDSLRQSEATHTHKNPHKQELVGVNNVN